LKGSEGFVSPSDPSRSTSPRLAKRRPRPESTMRNTFQGQSSLPRRESWPKVKTVEEDLKELLSVVCSLPPNTAQHLESVAAQLLETGISIEQLGDERSGLFSSNIGKILIVIKNCIAETYLYEPKTSEIISIINNLIIQCTSIFLSAVKLILSLVF